MFLLPGTFVSVGMLPNLNRNVNLKLNNERFTMQALFSMVFFDTKTNENGSETLTIGHEWWLFPLTILVFVTWITWQRHRT